MTKDRAVVFFVWEHPEHDEEYRGAPAAPPNPAVGAGGPPRSQLLRGAYRRECEAGPRAGAVQFTPWNCCVWMGCYRRFVEVCRIYAAYTPWQWMGVATDHEDDEEIVELKNLARPRPPPPPPGPPRPSPRLPPALRPRRPARLPRPP